MDQKGNNLFHTPGGQISLNFPDPGDTRAAKLPEMGDIDAEKGRPWDYCPNCGHHLENRGCKYRCPRCHYFMSCSDFD